jgi:ribosomal protein S18 acetylase RimI-like enzyme
VKEENSVMTWSRQNIEKPLPTQYPCCRSATIDDMEHIADIIAIAFGYNTANYDWLRYTIKKKMSMPKSYKIFVATVPGDQGDVILFSPPGLPHLGYVGSVATDPDHQRKGLAALCLQFALESTAKPSQTFYLETFEETHHAFRMYEKIGFRFEGRIKTFMVALEENK